MTAELPFEKLCRTCDPASLDSSNSSQISTLKTIIGQERAVKSATLRPGDQRKRVQYLRLRQSRHRQDDGDRTLSGGDRRQGTRALSTGAMSITSGMVITPTFCGCPPGKQSNSRRIWRNLSPWSPEIFATHSKAKNTPLTARAVIKNIQEQKHQLFESLNEQAHKLNFALQAVRGGFADHPFATEGNRSPKRSF